jgi:hypothetical protein
MDALAFSDQQSRHASFPDQGVCEVKFPPNSFAQLCSGSGEDYHDQEAKLGNFTPISLVNFGKLSADFIRIRCHTFLERCSSKLKSVIPLACEQKIIENFRNFQANITSCFSFR